MTRKQSAPIRNICRVPGGQLPVAIVGGGYSGTILAVELARKGIECLLIDGSGRTGRGTAYSTIEPAHLLNVPAQRMSAFADQPDHFSKKFASEGGDPTGFAERRFYGRYLDEILEAAIAGGKVRSLNCNARSAKRDGLGWAIGLDDGRTLGASALVLAMGNQSPAPLEALGDAGPHYIADPWGEGVRPAIDETIRSGGDVFLLGTGLTMIDTVLSLHSEGFEGNILAMSRRGQTPRSHAPVEPAPVEFDDLPSGDLIGLWRWLRRRGAEVGWRAAVDSLRPHSHALWQGLTIEQQRRFLRHARPYWDVHRHRIAPRVGQQIAQLIGDGRLHIGAGRIVVARDIGNAIEVKVRRRGAKSTETRNFELLINCTGPLHAIGRTRDELLRSLLDAGEAAPDPLGIGLAVGDSAKVAGADRLWAMGSLTKGRYWEIIAVPDIREQAAVIAADIAGELGHDRPRQTGKPGEGDLVAAAPKIAVPPNAATATKSRSCDYPQT